MVLGITPNTKFVYSLHGINTIISNMSTSKYQCSLNFV